jgi:hypothetical protein
MQRKYYPDTGVRVKQGSQCLTLLSKIFQLYHVGKFYWWRKSGYPEKTTDLSQVRQTLLHNVVSSTPHRERVSNSQLYS